VSDVLCSYVTNPRNFGGTCTGSAPVVTGNTITWPAFSLAKNSSCTITYDVTADVSAGGAQCPTSVTCVNNAHVDGQCAGSAGASTVHDDTSWPTTIQCLSLNCPRTVGFWAAQCAQKGNGSTKYDLAHLTSLAQCVNTQSAFFDWAPGSEEQQFCRTISPPLPMDIRKQTKRQFAGLLANLCASSTNNQPTKGGKIILDPSSPITCSGVTAKTVGELIAEVDAALIALEGQNLNSASVKAQYAALEGCLDAINNGIAISVTSDCEDGGTSTGSSDADVSDGSASAPAVELYKAAPNPFQASTSFSYQVKNPAGSPVAITIYNVAGRQVRQLVSNFQEAGIHSVTWDGRSDDGARLDRGIYFVRTAIAGVRENTLRILYLP